MSPAADRRLIVATHEFHPHRGGIAVYAAEMAAAAAGLGHKVEVWAPALPAGTVERAWPFKVRRLAMGGSHSLRDQWRMARALLRERKAWDHALLYVPEPGPILALQVLQLIGRLPPGPLVITLHGSDVLKLGMRPLVSWSARRLLTRADRLSVVSRHTQALLEEFFPGFGSKVVLTPGALRSDFRPGAGAARPAGADDKVIILTVARLHPRKGQLRLIEALRALEPRQKGRIEYWLAGGHSKEGYEPALQAAARDAGFPVKFLGEVDDAELGGLYAQANIFAMTSVPHKLSVEGFGLVYLEAGAHGLPVVAHAIGGVPDAVRHDETGLLVPPDDPAALTAALARLIDDPALRRRLGAAGRELARRHSWADNALALFGRPGDAGSR